MTHTEFYEEAVDIANTRGKTHEDRVECMLGVIAESLAAIADNYEKILGDPKDNAEFIDDNA